MIWYHRGSEGRRKAYLILEKMHHSVEGVWMGLGLAAGTVGNQCSLGLSESCSVVSDSLQTHELYSPWNSPGQNTGVGSLSLLQGVFPTRGLNPGLSHYRPILLSVQLQRRPLGYLGLNVLIYLMRGLGS